MGGIKRFGVVLAWELEVVAILNEGGEEGAQKGSTPSHETLGEGSIFELISNI